MINFEKYNEIILDFDGVVLDSNFIKEKAIIEVSKKYMDNTISKKFVEYFIKNNGLPREIKITKYFNEQQRDLVLDFYNSLLEKNLLNANFTSSFDIFLNKLEFYKIQPYILSGGDEKEIKSLLHKRNYLSKFKKIMGGPKTKYENLELLNVKGNILYIGDSKIDFDVSSKYSFDFIFMYGYTQFTEWKDFFRDKPQVTKIRNLEALTDSKC